MLNRAAAQRRRFLIAALAGMLGGCSTSSNRFQYANATRRDRDRIAELDRAETSPPIVAVPAAPPARSGGAGPSDLVGDAFDPPPSGPPRDEFPLSPGQALGLGADPPRAADPFDPPSATGGYAGNRTRVIETPRPGDRGTRLVEAATGAELAGRVINSYGRPEPGVSIQVSEAARGQKVVAEVASGVDGSFRVAYLEYGVQYRLDAAAVASGRRLVGTALATPPDTAVVIQIDREGTAGFSAVGNRVNQAGSGSRQDRTERPGADRSENEFALTGINSRVDPAFAALTAYSLDGRSIRLADAQGRLILLDFFGSWCGPCRRSVPAINSLHRRYASRGLRVVGVASESGDRNAAIAQTRRAVSELGIDYTVVATPSDEPSAAREHFSVTSYPTLVLIDRGGRVLFRHTGVDPESMRRLEAIIASRL